MIGHLDNFRKDRFEVPSLASRHGNRQVHNNVMRALSTKSMAALPVVLNADGARLEGPPTLRPPRAAAIACRRPGAGNNIFHILINKDESELLSASGSPL